MSYPREIETAAKITTGPARKRVLLVCHRFATPDHTGAFRWQAMVNDLTQWGWVFDVLTLSPPDNGAGSPGRTGVEIIPIPECWWGQRLRQGVAGALARWSRLRGDDDDSLRVEPRTVRIWQPGDRRHPVARIKDAAVGATALLTEYIWTRRARRRARGLARQHTYQAVVVTSPAFLPQLVGAELARRYAIPYIAEFRDPWYYGRGADLARVDDTTRLVWRHCERRTMRAASVAVDIAERAQRVVRAALPAESCPPRQFIPSGHTMRGAPAAPDPERFTVVYSGWLWPFMPVPALLAACGRLRARHRLGPDSFRVEFLGPNERFAGVPLAALARGSGLDTCFDHAPRVPREQANPRMQAAAVLGAFDSVCPQGLCIPSKLYHYAATRGALLLIGRPDGAMAEEAAKIGQRVHEPGDAKGIDAALERALRHWRRGALTEPSDAHGRFDARHASIAMDRLLSTMNERAPGRETT